MEEMRAAEQGDIGQTQCVVLVVQLYPKNKIVNNFDQNQIEDAYFPFPRAAPSFSCGPTQEKAQV